MRIALRIDGSTKRVNHHRRERKTGKLNRYRLLSDHEISKKLITN